MADIVNNYCCEVFNRMQQRYKKYHTIQESDRVNERQPLNPVVEEGDREAPRQSCCVKYKWMIVSSLGTFLMIVLILSLSLGVYALVHSNEKYTAYERFGHEDCLNNQGTEMIYTGFAAGFQTTTGATTIQCLPKDKKLIDYGNQNPVENKTGIHSLLVVEYKSFLIHGSFNVPCARCGISGRNTLQMFPASDKCPDDTWTTEYSGYLMTDDIATIFVCVDKEMMILPNTEEPVANAPVLRHMLVPKNIGKSITNEYDPDKVLTCAVCSK